MFVDDDSKLHFRQLSKQIHELRELLRNEISHRKRVEDRVGKMEQKYNTLLKETSNSELRCSTRHAVSKFESITIFVVSLLGSRKIFAHDFGDKIVCRKIYG
jgi:hypothetical protein